MEKDILNYLEDLSVIKSGHFILSSGLHSQKYVQCAKIFEYPDVAEKLCKMLAEKIRAYIGNKKIDMIVSPAMGGVIVGYEMAKQLGIRNVFLERVDGAFELRRGFEIEQGSNVIVIEDVVTTGKSSLEVVKKLESFGANILSVASIINRSGNNIIKYKDKNINLISLLDIDIPVYHQDNLPEELKKLDAIKPGSRFINNKK